MAERLAAGVLDTCTYIDLGLLDPESLPVVSEITAITMAELHQGVAMARSAAVRAARTEKLGAAIVDFDPLPFDAGSAARFGTLVALVLSAGRDPRPRRMDLMIAAIASSRGLPLYTRKRRRLPGSGRSGRCRRSVTGRPFAAASSPWPARHHGRPGSQNPAGPGRDAVTSSLTPPA